MEGPQVYTDSSEPSEANTTGRKRRKSERERKRQRERSRKRMRLKAIDLRGSSSCDLASALRKPTFLSVLTPKGTRGKLHFLKGIFPLEMCAKLAEMLERESPLWRDRRDPSRIPTDSASLSRSYFIAGKWCAVGHARPGVDGAHWAKPVGDLLVFPQQDMVECLQYFARVASENLERYQPEIFHGVHGLYESIFGAFHIFFGLRGIVRQHVDRNDAISFIFPIQMEEGSKGGLEIGGSGLCCASKPGDAVLFDSDLLSHGVPEYLANPSERIVGVFAIQKNYLRLHGLRVDKENPIQPIHK